MKDIKINLGTKTAWWILRIILVAPIWLTTIARLPWKKYVHGLIEHKCEYDYDNPEYYKGYKHYLCKHYGCNTFSSKEKDGSWIDFAENFKLRNIN